MSAPEIQGHDPKQEGDGRAAYDEWYNREIRFGNGAASREVGWRAWQAARPAYDSLVGALRGLLAWHDSAPGCPTFLEAEAAARAALSQVPDSRGGADA